LGQGNHPGPIAKFEDDRLDNLTIGQLCGIEAHFGVDVARVEVIGALDGHGFLGVSVFEDGAGDAVDFFSGKGIANDADGEGEVHGFSFEAGERTDSIKPQRRTTF